MFCKMLSIIFLRGSLKNKCLEIEIGKCATPYLSKYTYGAFLVWGEVAGLTPRCQVQRLGKSGRTNSTGASLFAAAMAHNEN